MGVLTFLNWIIVGLFVLGFLGMIASLCFIWWVVKKDKSQFQHSIRRNYPFIGWARYILENISPEIRQYFIEDDENGTPYARSHFQMIIKGAKYLTTIIPFGSERNFEGTGLYIKNALFPKQLSQLQTDNETLIETKKYITDHENLFLGRFEHIEETKAKPWLYTDDDAVILGEHTCKYPFKVKSPIGMSGMSFGALGGNAIEALSTGIHLAGAFMNTGEGGLSPYHLKGGANIICQIGPGKFGFRDLEGNFSFEELKKKAAIEQVKAFELKLGQGAKIRGGHLEGSKVTEEIAAIRGVEPWKTVNSPNRFDEFDSPETLLEFVTKIRKVAQKPIGIKIVVGGPDSLEELAEAMVRLDQYPDFISVDGGEGGTGATYKAMADSVGLPAKPALMIVDETLKKYNIRNKMKLISSGKMFSADRIAIALSMGADLVQLARGMMISIGCIGAKKCHSNQCPVGVATTNPKLQQALVIEEKKYRACNYILALREDLFALAAAAGISSPRKFSEKHVVQKYDDNTVVSLKEIKKHILTKKVI